MVELAPKAPALTSSLPSWRWLLWASIVLVIVVILGYIGLRFYLSKLDNQVIDLNNKIKAAATAVNLQDEQTIVKFNDSLNVLGSLFSSHTYFSNFFNLLNTNTYPKVSYRSTQVDAVKNLITLQGKTQSYTALAKQIVALRVNPLVNGVDVAGIAFTVDGLQFTLKLDVKPDIFRQAK